ncbi:hypothetical protein H0266_02320 [Halobacillus locisalis]|uniref:Uncharacterized protein n=1 Tax=Halobacillus locisalis TaxID=220753 RepID=A0A838CPQ0_9BACI|nr:hypothetical protein [Halobacillus locisalis]MBA2173725.1 hypothetical protein [Halobacillus locisalis]
MRRCIVFILLWFLLPTTAVYALDWGPFVVWEGKVYDVTYEKLRESQIGDQIGEVRTKPNDRSGSFYGDASNVYPKGTPYYTITSTSTESAIAVREGEGVWVKAHYSHQAPFHVMNIITNLWFILVMVVFFTAGVLVYGKRKWITG